VIVRRGLRRWRRREKLRLLFDPACPICRAWVGLAVVLDIRQALLPTSFADHPSHRTSPGQDPADLHRDMVVIDQPGSLVSGRPALGALLRACPLLWPLAPLHWRPVWRPIATWHRQVVGAAASVPTVAAVRDTAPAPQKTAAK
jgi:predicted DCC family thiol-disulfide oxidoreductase YuxK